MRLTCPCCGSVNSLEALLTDAAARQAVATALKLPAGLGERLLRYLGLFRAQGRVLGWDRVARLLEELLVAIEAGHIERHGQTWSAPLDYWRLALDQILDSRPTLVLPLKGHGYLYEIVAGLARKAGEQRAARAEVADERARAREGERSGQVQSAAALANPWASVPPEGQGADVPRPSASRPPADFRRLAQTLRGKTDPEMTDADPARPVPGDAG
ncbi:MAG: hypothetical protein P9F75_07420 [Candidatus Contendobacter sp.]|nr:hypothetical protein [Candidatus Contendobacter sp.]